MKKKFFRSFVFFTFFVASTLVSSLSMQDTQIFANETLQVVTLPDPEIFFSENDDSLLKALKNRHTHRKFSQETLDEKNLSSLLWAAYGINRDDGKRTIPTARNRQDMHIYIINKAGFWLYNPQNHSIEQKIAGDTRQFLGSKISQNAPLTLIYVQDMDKAGGEHYGYLHAGSMYQNVGLFCAMANLGNVVIGSLPSDFKENLHIPENHKLIVSQSVGKKE